MGARTLECKSKIQKLDEGQTKDDGINRINSLPDLVLQHIISFLLTKEAVRTSILSGRWQYLWTSIPNLDFVEGKNKRQLFVDFVERVLCLHDSSNIKKFSLSCKVLSDELRINAWISSAVRRKVQELNICLDGGSKPFVLPNCFFTCESVTELELSLYWVFRVPSLVCFSRLKILTLTEVTFSDDRATQQLFSGCPVLETLIIFGCNWMNLKAVSISSPRLQRVEICDYDDSDTPSNCQVMIFCTTLEFFVYSGELRNDYCLCNLLSLVSAEIAISIAVDRKREIAYRLNKLLMGISNATYLTLSNDAVEVLSYAEELFAHLPLFNNLTHFTSAEGMVKFDCGLLNILQSFPCLNFLVLREGVSFSAFCKNDDQMLSLVPSCFLSYLTSISIGIFYGTSKELNVVKFLLKNATILDRMVIYLEDESREELKEVQEKIMMLPRGSRSCTIIFS